MKMTKNERRVFYAAIWFTVSGIVINLVALSIDRRPHMLMLMLMLPVIGVFTASAVILRSMRRADSEEAQEQLAILEEQIESLEKTLQYVESRDDFYGDQGQQYCASLADILDDLRDDRAWRTRSQQVRPDLKIEHTPQQ
jgi:uncharacterized membrane protein